MFLTCRRFIKLRPIKLKFQATHFVSIYLFILCSISFLLLTLTLCHLACDGGDQKNISYEEITGPLHKKMPEHPCYHPCLVSDRSGVNLKRDDTMVSGKRRAEECPICSSNGVGVAVARAVPSFPPPLSVLVCRGSGAVMSHENPPMALPNGQVSS